LLSYVWSLLSITMIGARVTLFGNFGKFLSIILLIVQLSASGGTFLSKRQMQFTKNFMNSYQCHIQSLVTEQQYSTRHSTTNLVQSSTYYSECSLVRCYSSYYCSS